MIERHLTALMVCSSSSEESHGGEVMFQFNFPRFLYRSTSLRLYVPRHPLFTNYAIDQDFRLPYH